MQIANKRKVSFLKLLIVQAVAVAFLLAFFAVVKRLSPNDYRMAEQKYIDVMENEAVNEETNETMQKAWSKIKAFFVDEKNETIQNAGGKDEDANGNRYPDNCSASKYIINEDICRPAQGKISSAFGYRINPISGKLSFHTGIDIAANAGDAVRAAYYGMVEETGEDSVYGKYIKINHGNGIKTFYAHCSKIKANTGDIVEQGDVIALVGSTGWSTGAHLHFSIIIDGIYCNPGYVIH